MNVEVKTIKRHAYAGKKRLPGDRYEMRRDHAKLFAALGNVEIVTPEPPTAAQPEVEPRSPRRRRYKTRVMEPEGQSPGVEIFFPQREPDAEANSTETPDTEN